MGQDNAAQSGVRRSGGEGSLRKSGASDGNKRVSKKVNSKPPSKVTAAKNELMKSTLYAADGHKTEESNEFQGYHKLKKIPDSKLVPGRDGDYGQESSKLIKSHLRADVQSLSLKLDEPNGVSEQAEVYHFDYEKALHHYVSWEDKEGKKVIMQSKLR